MKKLLSVVLTVLMVASLMSTAVWAAVTPTAGWFESFSGDTYTITSAEDLAAFAAASSDFAGKTVILTKDIEYTDAWTGKASFAGTFDGQGYKITLSSASQGLFVALSGDVKNLTLKATISGGVHVGGIAGTGKGGTLTNVKVEGSVYGSDNNVGGFFGQLNGATTFVSCWNAATIESAKRYVSGFVGNNQSNNTTLTDCLNTGSVTATSNNDAAGGLVGAAYAGTNTMTNCLNIGKVTDKQNGGMTGALGNRDDAAKSYTNCYALAGSADYICGVKGKEPIEGQFEWIEATAYEATCTALGANWAMYEGIPVPAVFVPATEIEIGTWDELVAWAADASNNEGMTVYLTADITAPEGATWTPKAELAGIFDGQGYSISGLKGAQGLLNKLYGTVQNLAIKDSAFTGSTYTAAIAGTAYYGAALTNVYSNATITATSNHNGGLVAMIASKDGMDPVVFTQCWFDGVAKSTHTYISGIAGNQNNNKAVFVDCLNTGTVQAPGNIAGISASVYDGGMTATNCVNNGLITTDGTNPALAGIAWTFKNGATGSVLTNCYTVEGTAANALPQDIRDACSITFNGATITKDNMKTDTTTGWVADATDAAAFAGLDFENVWVMTVDGPQLQAWAYSEVPVPDTIISNWDELVAWATNGSDDAGKTVILTADITAPEGATWAGKSFAGTFEGDYHIISGLNGNTGLFDSVYGGTVQNLAVVNSVVAKPGSSVCGGVSNAAGNDAKFINIYCNSDVSTDNHAGGIVGCMFADKPGLTLESCWFDGTCTVAQRYASGILANQNSAKGVVITNCLNTGAISGAGNGSTNCCLAGIDSAVYSGECTVTNSVNLGMVTCTGDALDKPYETAGIIGRNNDGTIIIENCYVLEGTANYAEHGAGNTNGTGNTFIITAEEYADTIEALGEGWGVYWTDFENFIPVPAVFANNKPLDPDVIQISTWAQLLEWAADTENTDKNVYLMADIVPSEAVGLDWTPKAEFTGNFDGQNYMIQLPASAQGLFQTLGGNVSNLALSGIVAGSESNNLGILAGTINKEITIDNVLIGGSVTLTGAEKNNAGGFAGQIDIEGKGTVTFTNCINAADITCGHRYVSGFVGNNQSNNTVFENCLNAGKVLLTATEFSGNEPIASGFAGAVYAGQLTMTNCVNLGEIVSSNEGPTGALSFRGDNITAESFVNCFALKGTADCLSKEKDNAVESEGQFEWIEEISNDALAALAGEWVLVDNGTETMPVPKDNAVSLESFEALGYTVSEIEAPAPTTSTVAPSTSTVKPSVAPSSSSVKPSVAPSSSFVAPTSSSVAPTSSVAAGSSAAASSGAAASSAATPSSNAPITSDASFTLIMLAIVVLSAGAFVVVNKARSRA